MGHETTQEETAPEPEPGRVGTCFVVTVPAIHPPFGPLSFSFYQLCQPANDSASSGTALASSRRQHECSAHGISMAAEMWIDSRAGKAAFCNCTSPPGAENKSKLPTHTSTKETTCLVSLAD
ncbi:28S ribosomal protein S16, mitochondrial-like [Platysternon megacephalum]|uniref:28S ribosomal protein S16, mitochondrial-like n=1 Tax=Platysternon megacephalum TaxID=55544 RepID=A0A4D9F816_9SAUR|nr:28S ribosomal protein S16, mitochondrial-like [Platysternon megacephalum]